MQVNNKFVAGLLLGAVAGAALVLFLKSEKGEELVSELKDSTGNIPDSLSLKLQNFETAVNELLEKGKSFISDFEKEADQLSS